jgi:phosphatidylserine/phosphatidylglycerophosphate/cardiolipin synthase-like enzyme
MTNDSSLTTYHADMWAQSMSVDIDAASRSVFITALSMLVPAHVPDCGVGLIYRALQRASARHIRVDVRLAAPSRFAPASQSNILSAKRLAADGINVQLVPGARLLHAKTCTIDGSIVWIGSGNFTQQAAISNFEAYLRTVNTAIADRLLNRWKGLP